MNVSYREAVAKVGRVFAVRKAARYLSGAQDPRIGSDINSAALTLKTLFDNNFVATDLSLYVRDLEEAVDGYYETALAELRGH